MKLWQDWATVKLQPIFEFAVAIQLMIFLMSLVFSYEELFGASPEEKPIRLTDEEIDRLKKRYDEEQAKNSENGSKEESKSAAKAKPSYRGVKKEKAGAAGA